MYNGRSIVTGLVLFFALLTFPFWYGLGAAPAPEPDLNTPAIQKLVEKKCVENREFMRANHMELLKEWRNAVVRTGNRVYIAGDGKKYEMSLQNTCLDCHANIPPKQVKTTSNQLSQVQFCNSCHSYVGVKPDCWTCHIQPKEGR